MVVQVSRFVFFAGGIYVGYALSTLVDWPAEIGYSQQFVVLILIVLGASMGFLFGGIIGRELTTTYRRIEERLDVFTPMDLALGSGGLVVGLLVALMISQPFRALEPQWLALAATFLIYWLCAYGGIRIAMLKGSDMQDTFARMGGDGSGTAHVKYLDTSAVIDGRFVELRRGGFLEGPLRVPRFVIAELQTLADSEDDTKRARGRRGLDQVAVLGEGDDGATTFEADYPELAAVDEKLLRLARETHGAIVTTDFNLTKVARVSDVAVLNVNEIATALKPVYLPGDELEINVVKEGKESGQGVGYLEDGTMVVIAEAKDHVGSTVLVEVTSVLQTGSGRMVFARLGQD